MPQDDAPLVPAKTLRDHVRSVARRMRQSRPVSFYLLLTIVPVLLLARPTYTLMHQPNRFALVLAMLFLFLFVVMARAMLDASAILRQYLREEREIYQATLGDAEFRARLRERVADRREPK